MIMWRAQAYTNRCRRLANTNQHMLRMQELDFGLKFVCSLTLYVSLLLRTALPVLLAKHITIQSKKNAGKIQALLLRGKYCFFFLLSPRRGFTPARTGARRLRRQWRLWRTRTVPWSLSWRRQREEPPAWPKRGKSWPGGWRRETWRGRCWGGARVTWRSRRGCWTEPSRRLTKRYVRVCVRDWGGNNGKGPWHVESHSPPRLLSLSDGGDDGRFPSVGGRPANSAGRLQGPLEEGPAGGPAQQQGQAGRAAEGPEQPQGPAGGGEGGKTEKKRKKLNLKKNGETAWKIYSIKQTSGTHSSPICKSKITQVLHIIYTTSWWRASCFWGIEKNQIGDWMKIGRRWIVLNGALHLVFPGFPSEEGAAGVQRGERQRPAGERPPQQPLQTLGERTGDGEEHPHWPHQGDQGPGGEPAGSQVTSLGI